MCFPVMGGHDSRATDRRVGDGPSAAGRPVWGIKIGQIVSARQSRGSVAGERLGTGIWSLWIGGEWPGTDTCASSMAATGFRGTSALQMAGGSTALRFPRDHGEAGICPSDDKAAGL